jgi:C-terminal processing protease CtpA/Prc
MSVRDNAGTTTEVDVPSVPIDLVEGRKAEIEAEHHTRRAEMLSNKIAYLRPGPFYAIDEETLEDFEAFIDESFEAFIEEGATDLLIDLRFNPGGDNSFSDPMIAWFADQPFRFASRFVVKTSQQTRVGLEALSRTYPDGISAQMLAAMLEHKEGETFDFEIPFVEPRANGYRKRVWVLINRHSYSNATSVAAIVQDYAFATVLGEETADLPSSYASSARFKLPETAIEVTYPKAYFVRPNGVESLNQGVVPDVSIDDHNVWAVDDHELKSALEHILSSRDDVSPSSE